MRLIVPMRVLAWEDDIGRSWLGYKDPTGIGHGRSDRACDAALTALTVSLDELVREAARITVARDGVQAVFETDQKIGLIF